MSRQQQRRLNHVQTTKLVADYLAGKNIKELAATYRVHRNSVTAHLARAGVGLRPKGLLKPQVDEAVRLYADGWALVKLAARLGCDPETVRSALKMEGVELRKPWERG